MLIGIFTRSFSFSAGIRILFIIHNQSVSVSALGMNSGLYIYINIKDIDIEDVEDVASPPTYDVPADPEDLAVVSVRSGELVEAVVRGGCSAGVGG